MSVSEFPGCLNAAATSQEVSRWAAPGTSKRALDITASAVGLLLLSPLLLLVALLVKLTSRGPILFRQERMGQRFHPFWMYKFRSMIAGRSPADSLLTVGADPRITRLGRLLRKTKIDELPQLWNVLKGDMSLVGPRPEFRPYVELFRRDYEELLTVRPGLTDLASLKYRNEATLLAQAADSERRYVEHILPDKIQLAKYYVRHASLLLDLQLILKTVFPLPRFKAS